MKKRALSWLLALTMLLTLAPQTLPVWASAEESSTSGSTTESKLSANTYSALGLSRSVSLKDEGLSQNKQPYGDAIAGNTVATNVINELYVNFNGSIHYGWSILDNLTMQWTDTAGSNWTSADNFAGAMKYWRPNQQEVHYKNGNQEEGALFATNKTAGKHNKLGDYINSANKHLVYQYSKSEAFSPNTGKDNYVAEMVLDTDNNVWLYIYQVEGGNKRYVRGANLGKNDFAGDKNTVIWNWEYDAMFDIAAGDMDGDGYDEIAVYTATSNKQAVHLYKYTGGALTEITTKPVTVPSNSNATGQNKKLGTAVVTLAFGDLNADDKDELVIAENIGYGATNIDKGKVGIYRLETNESTKKNTLVKAMQDDISLGIPGSSGIFNNAAPMIRYANVATGDIDGDYQDELIIAGYVSAKMNNAKCNRGDIAYMIVKGNSDNQFKHSDWKAVDTNKNRIDLLDRVVDNENQLIPPVALTCAATQGVGHSEQLFLGGWLYSVGLSADMSVTLSPLTRISTNREYKKDNGNKANKEEIFVVNVVAGNFNGNRNGQEQIVYAFGMKHDESDRYWYDIGYINKKEPGDTNANSSSGYWYGQEQVMNFESSYNRDQNKSRASLYLSLAAVDCDNDSTLMRYKGQTVTWTKPEVLTILQSAPYFQDLEDTRGYLDQGQTGLGKSKAAGDKVTAGGSLSLGTYVSFEQDFSVFGVKVASIEAEAQSKNSFTYAYEETKKKETEINYSGSAGDDYAVVYAVPYMEYQYETWVPEYTLPPSKNEEYYKYIDNYLSGKLKNWSTIKSDPSKLSAERTKAENELGIRPNMTVEGSWQPSSVMVPMEPAKVLITVDDYDEIAEQTEGLEPIRGNILNSTPGDPATYDAVGARSNDFHAIGNQQKVTTGEGGNITVTETSTTEKSHDFEYSYEFEAKVGAGAGGLTVGVLAGFGANAGGGISTSSSKSYSATVDNLPKDASQYGFSWQFGWRNAKLNNNDVLVLEYQLDGVKQLPSMPKNLRVDSVTSNSVTLKWDPVVGAGAYKIYQASTTGDNKKYCIATVPGTATSYTDTSVNPNNIYTYCVQNVSQVGGESIYSTDVRAITLTDANGNFVIKQQPEELTTYVGGTATTTVEAEYLKNGQSQGLRYYWERYNTKTKKWDNYSDGSPQLSVSVTKDTVDGTKYRCLVFYNANLYIYTDPVTLTIGKANSKTDLSSAQAGQTVNASYVEKKEVTSETEKKIVPHEEKIGGETYLMYTKGNDITVYMKDGKYYSKNGNTANLITEEEENVQLTYIVKTTTPATEDKPATETVEEKTISFSAMKKDITFNPTTTKVEYTYQAEPTNTSSDASDSGTGSSEGSTDSENGTVTYTATERYTVDNSNVVVYHCYEAAKTEDKAAIDFWFVQSDDNKYAADVQTATKLKIDEETEVDVNDLVQAEDEVPVVKTEETYKEGDTVTLTATPSDQSQAGLKLSGKVVFKIVNSIGDGSKTLDAVIGEDGTATAEWIPTAAGVYTITAAYEGNEKYMGSVSGQTITINVVVPEQKTLMIDSPNSMTYGDAAIELKTTLLKGAKNSESASVETNLNGVTYSVKNADGTAVPIGSTFAPTAAGTYTVTATYTSGSETLTATKSIVVNKRTVTIVPKVEGTGTTKTATYSLANCMTSDESLFTNKIQVTCAGTAPNAVAGEYPYTVTYTPGENEAAINSKYIVVIDTMHPYVLKDDMVTVTDKTSSNNGTVTLRYRSSSTDSYVDVYGDSVPKNAEVIAVASPKAGYRVKQWKVNGQRITTGQDGALNTAQTITVASSATKDYTVEAEFELVYHTLSFEVKNESGQATGTVSAKYLRDSVESGAFTSGDKVSYFDRVRLTANVTEGQSIKEWQITRNNGTPETLKIDNEVYTGNSYVLSSITADTEVTVITENQTDCTVKVHLVDKNGDPLTGGQVLFNGATQEANPQGTFTYSGHKNDDLTVALTLPSGLVVDEWLRKEGETSTALQIGSFTNNKTTWHVVNLPDSLDLTVKCSTPNSYTITTSTTVQGGTEGDNGGTIEVYQIGTTGQVDTVLQGSDLLVKVKHVNGYQLLDVTCNGTSQMSQMESGNEFRVNGVNENIIIVATFVKKPVVTFTAGSKGTIEVSNGPSVSGGTVPYGYKNDIVFTAKPEPGYEVDSWTVTGVDNPKGTPVANSDNQTYTYMPNAETGITSDLTVTVSFKALPKATVEFSVVDKDGSKVEGGFDGTIQATVARNGQSAPSGKVTSGTLTNVYRDSKVTFAAEPADGYKVTKWLLDDEKRTTSPVLDIGEEDNDTTKKVQVQFEKISNKITYAIDPTSDTGHGATLDVTFLANTGTSSEAVKSGNSVTTSGVLTATVNDLNDGYEIESWTLNGTPYTSTNGKLTCNVSETQGADIKVKIVRKSYQIIFSATEGGTITAKVDETALTSPASVKGDKQVTFTASTPETGYEFVGWKVDEKTVQSNSDPYVLTVSKNTSVQACYALTTAKYQVTYGIIQTSGKDNGTLAASGLDSNGKANAGSNITFTATPAAGYQVKQWYNAATSGTEIGVAENTTYEIKNLTANESVYVQFEPIPTYNITVNVSGQGSVTAMVNEKPATITNNTLEVKRHDSVVLTAEPEVGHHLKEWTGGIASQANPLTLTLSDVTAPHAITANFEVNQGVPFKTECGTGGSLEAKAGYGNNLQPIHADTGIQVDNGKKIVLTAKPGNGKAVVWTVNNQPTNELSNTYTIDAISENTTVKADFIMLELCTIPTDMSNDTYSISSVTKYPADYGEANQIRKGGTLSFKLTPKKPVMGLQGLPDNAQVVYNSDGSYTVTVTNVISNIAVTATAYQVEAKGLNDYKVPQSLKDANLNSITDIETKLKTTLTGRKEGIVFYDIVLKASDGTSVTTFPANGVYVTIPYPDGTNEQDTFRIVHMLTVDMNGKKAGEVEEITPITKGENGISFHVTSLSPFAIGWTKYVAPTPGGGGGGGGGGAVSTYTLTFDTNGGSAIDKITKDSGMTIDLATYKPTRAGYTFAGWFSDKALTKAVTSVKLTANTTVYAKWTQNGGTAQNPFVDVKEGAYYYDAVLWAVGQKITSGTSATTFSPDASCTRAQMVTFLWRAAGSPKVENGKNPFADVKADAYYYDAVLWAVEKGVTSGTSATTFSPDTTVTRGQTVTFLYRNAGSPEVSGTMPFTDVEADAYYAKAVQWAVQQKITTGTSETTFSPMSDCTRGQIVTFLYRAK